MRKKVNDTVAAINAISKEVDFRLTRIEYPISANYCKSWTVVEAIREIIANAKDEGRCRLWWRNGFGHVRDFGVGLQREHLIIGEGEEKSNEQIGQFGEGLKIASLVLSREGRQIKGKTIDFGFSFTFEMSDYFKTEVMCLRVSEDDILDRGSEIIFECSREEFETARALFLPPWITHRLLKDRPGELYINGVFAQRIDSLFGYNIIDKSATNRDRSILDVNKVRNAVSFILSQELVRTESIRAYLAARKGDHFEYTVDFNVVRPYTWKRVLEQMVGKRYCIASGVDANTAAHDAGYFVITPVTQGFESVLMGIGVSYASHVSFKKARSASRKVRSLLSPEQKKTLRKAKKAAQNMLGIKLYITVVDKIASYADRATEADYNSLQERVRVTVEVIDRGEGYLTGVLVHEGLHAKGYNDVTRDFESALTEMIGKFATKKKRKVNA